jgi:acetyl-CoA carboxylase biotin carboxyl carrier protein
MGNKKIRTRKKVSVADGSISLEELRSLIELFKETGVSGFELVSDDMQLKVSLGGSGGFPVIQQASLPAAAPPANAEASAPPAGAGEISVRPVPQEPAEPDQKPGKIIESPIVGTFYSAPSPESPPYVEVGAAVTADTVLCIIEAMKIMNEIKAETSGTIAEIYVENEQAVEFGQPMFRIE